MIRFITFSFGILLLLAGCSDEKSVFSVEIADFKGGNVILMHDGKRDDTLKKVADNLFEGTISVKNPNEGLIFCDAYKTSIPLYFEKGMNVKLSINFVPGKIDLMEIMVPEFKYEGDNWDCTEFIMDLQDYLYGDNQKWSNHDLTQISFSQYYKEVLADKDSILLSLSKISSNTFKELKQKYVDDENAAQSETLRKYTDDAVAALDSSVEVANGEATHADYVAAYGEGVLPHQVMVGVTQEDGKLKSATPYVLGITDIADFAPLSTADINTICGIAAATPGE